MNLVAQNQYFNRDYRRAFPKTEFVNQNELATLLIAQGEAFTSSVIGLRPIYLIHLQN